MMLSINEKSQELSTGPCKDAPSVAPTVEPAPTGDADHDLVTTVEGDKDEDVLEPSPMKCMSNPDDCSAGQDVAMAGNDKADDAVKPPLMEHASVDDESTLQPVATAKNDKVPEQTIQPKRKRTPHAKAAAAKAAPKQSARKAKAAPKQSAMKAKAAPKKKEATKDDEKENQEPSENPPPEKKSRKEKDEIEKKLHSVSCLFVDLFFFACCIALLLAVLLFAHCTVASWILGLQLCMGHCTNFGIYPRCLPSKGIGCSC